MLMSCYDDIVSLITWSQFLFIVVDWSHD